MKAKSRAAKRRTRRRKPAHIVKTPTAKKVLVVDVGGTSVKILATGQTERRSFPSGPTLTPKRMVAGVKKFAQGWTYNVVSMGYPGPVLHSRPMAEPYNLGRAWVGFDFAKEFGHPVKVVNDAAMQALGSYRGGKMLFLGLGTGLGSTMIVNGIVEPMELSHLRLPMKTMWAEPDWSVMARRNGAVTWPMSWRGLSPRSSPMRL